MYAPAEHPEYVCPRCTKDLRVMVISPDPICPRCTSVCKLRVPPTMKRVRTHATDFSEILGRAWDRGTARPAAEPKQLIEKPPKKETVSQ